ncbi:hypothetical protein JGS22_015095 [Streptomyces sp. P38-E01]|uniref:Uncharacterized protein n=1 Tax=Streptomyces tardus TaxID=2780544 RepID=A0A949JHU8_9ACTN|nr:hypothetical protein [Streptomyces tardus]MBU7598905.1 hypothetical protein [Streptomyces tardus]
MNSRAQLCATLASPGPGLIRLITEIDDHGPIPPGALAATLPDLTEHHLRQAHSQACALGLAHHPHGIGLAPTTAGSALADLYHAAARWARRCNRPTPVASFTDRAQYTLDLLLRAEPGPDAEVGLPRELLDHLLDTAERNCH